MNRTELRPHTLDHLDFVGVESARRWGSFFQDIETLTGQVVETWADSLDAFAVRIDLSERIADRIESIRPGEGYASGGKESTLSMVGLCTGRVRRIPNLRQNTACPHYAWKKRQSTLRQLLYYVETGTRKGWLLRMFTVTSGTLVPVDKVVARWKWIRNRVRRLNAEPWFRRYFHVCFRSDELGGIYYSETGPDGGKRYKRDESGRRIRKVCPDTGRQLWHPHSHCIIAQTRWVPRRQLVALNRRINDWFAGRMRDEPLFDAREACKYCVKFADIVDLPDPDLLDWVDLMKGQRLVECYSGLRDLRRSLDLEQETIAAPSRANGWEYTRRPKVGLRPFDPDEDPDRKRLRDLMRLGRKPEAENLVLAVNLPAPAFGPISEPCAFVYHYNGDFAALSRQGFVSKVQAVAGVQYAAGVQLYLATAAAAPVALGSSHKVRKCPDGPELVFEEAVR